MLGRMLQIGSRQYEIVRAQSGFGLEILQNDRWQRTQAWRLDVHYVPSEFNTDALVEGEWEYLRVFLQAHYFAVKDWHDLGAMNEEAIQPLGATLDNLLAGSRSEKSFSIAVDCLEVKWVRDYLFHCRLEGILQREGHEENVELSEEIPFTTVSLRVPINAADTVAAARSIAARAIGAIEVAGAHVTPHDWRIREKAAGPIENSHDVTLNTAWRNYLA